MVIVRTSDSSGVSFTSNYSFNYLSLTFRLILIINFYVYVQQRKKVMEYV